MVEQSPQLFKPKMKDYLEIIRRGDAEMEIIAGPEEILLVKGSSVKELYRLIPLLDGTRTYSEILSELGNEDEVKAILNVLLEHSVVEEGAIPDSFTQEELEFLREQLIFFSHARGQDQRDKYAAQLRLKESTAAIISAGSLGPSLELVHSLCLNGVGTITVLRLGESKDIERLKRSIDSTSPCTHFDALGPILAIDQVIETLSDLIEERKASIVIVCLGGVLFPSLLRETNRVCTQFRVAWMIVQGPHGGTGQVGPIFIPGELPCYACLEARIKSNLEFFDQYDALEKELTRRRRASAEYGSLPQFAKMLAAVASTEIVKYLSGIAAPALLGSYITLNLLTYESQYHRVLRVPYCEHCGKSGVPLSPWSPGQEESNVSNQTSGCQRE